MPLAFLSPTVLPTQSGTSHVEARSIATTPRCSVRDSEAPPESRVSPNYPLKTRFEAPRLAFTAVPDFELLNVVGCYMEAPELDLELAATLRAQLLGQGIKSIDDLNAMFEERDMDQWASSTEDKYFPMSQRDDTPIIDLKAPSATDDGEVSVTIGKVEATPPEDEVDLRDPGFWKESVSGTVPQVRMPLKGRNMAPVIAITTFPEREISLQMEEILGEPEAERYPKETRFTAPKIVMKAPGGDWDWTGSIGLSMEEMQLDLNNGIKSF